MKLFECQNCGHPLYFENTTCESCGLRLGFLPALEKVSALQPDGQLWRAYNSTAIETHRRRSRVGIRQLTNGRSPVR